MKLPLFLDIETDGEQTSDYIKSMQFKPLLPSDSKFDSELLELIPKDSDLELDKRSNFAIPLDYIVQDCIPEHVKIQTKYWPGSIVHIAREELDSAFRMREEDNEVIANKIFFKMAFNFPWEYFFVAVCNSESTSQMDNNFELETMPGKNGLRVQFICETHYKTRSYVIFRSRCTDFELQKALFKDRYETFTDKWKNAECQRLCCVLRNSGRALLAHKYAFLMIAERNIQLRCVYHYTTAIIRNCLGYTVIVGL